MLCMQILDLYLLVISAFGIYCCWFFGGGEDCSALLHDHGIVCGGIVFFCSLLTLGSQLLD